MDPEPAIIVDPHEGPAVILPTHSEDGVDLTLIRWMLSLTPAQRLDVLQRSARSIMKLRDAVRNS